MDEYAYPVLWLLSQPFGIENNGIAKSIFRVLRRLKRQRDVASNIRSEGEALDKYWTNCLKDFLEKLSGLL